VRDVVIAQYQDLSQRNDHGQLWENFMISERKKCLLNGNTHLWGTYDDKEIDLLRPANRFRNEFKTGNFLTHYKEKS